MELRRLGTSDLLVSPLIMGTWQAGKKGWAEINDDEIVAALRAAVESGVNAFDTAEAYGNGLSERMLARALGPMRRQIVIATKISPHNLAAAKVTKSCNRSLRNLGTDYIDLYQIHWPAGSWGSPRVPITETMAALVRLREQGKIRAIGLSNFTRSQLEEAVNCTDIACVQVPYSLFWRQAEKEILPWCRERDLTVLAYSPLAQGILAGKFGPTPSFGKGDHRKRNKLFRPDNYRRVLHALGKMHHLAAAEGISLVHLALGWVMAQPQTCAIVGARNPAQVRENSGAMAVRLEEGVLRQLDRISRMVTDHLDPDPVLWEQ